MTGDRLHVKWVTNGASKSVELPPYAITNLEKAERHYKNFINERGAEFFKAALSDSDQFIFQTYDMVFYVANKTNSVSTS
jgi:hypothetical protein